MEGVSETFKEAVQLLHSNFIERLKLFQSRGDDEQDECESDMKQICELSSRLAGIFEGLYVKHRGQDEYEMYAVYSFIDSFFIQKNHALALKRLLHYEDTDSNAECGDDAWTRVYKSLMRGNLEEVLASHKVSQLKETHYKFYTDLEKQLESRHRYFNCQGYYRTEHEFITKFEELKRSAAKLKEATKYEPLKEFNQLTSLLAGNLETFSTDLKMNWKEYLLMHILFVDGVYNPRSFVLNTITDIFGDSLSDFDKLLIGFCRMETLHYSLQICAKSYPKYFTAHIVESLVMIYAIPTEPREEFEGLTYPENCFKEYVEEIIEIPEIEFEIPADYIINTLGRLPDALNMLERACMKRLRIDNEIAVRILDYLNTNELSVLNEFVYKRMYSINYDQQCYSEAFTWGCNSRDKDFNQVIRQGLLESALEMEIEDLSKFVGKLHEKVREISPEAYFLFKYCEFRKLLAEDTEGSFIDASSLLHEFLVQDIAPQQFWLRIFEEGLTLLQKEYIVFDWNDLMGLLEKYEILTNPFISNDCKFDNSTSFEISQVLTQAIGKSIRCLPYQHKRHNLVKDA